MTPASIKRLLDAYQRSIQCSLAKGLISHTKIYAILGGFHLSGTAFEPLIDQTCEMLAAFAPQVIVPTHCTGFRALHQLATRLPDAFIQSSVGTRFEL